MISFEKGENVGFGYKYIVKNDGKEFARLSPELVSDLCYDLHVDEEGNNWIVEETKRCLKIELDKPELDSILEEALDKFIQSMKNK